jgi:predicted secreted acid phosphatase
MKNYFIIIALFYSFFINQSFAKEKELINLSCAKNLVENYYKSGQYDKEVTAILKQAQNYLEKRVAENKNNGKLHRLALVLDIDDTSLSNFPALLEDDFSTLHFTENHTHKDEPAIKPMLDLYNTALYNDVSVFFISLRSETMRAITIDHLQKAGYSHWAGLYLPTDETRSPSYKANIRKMLIEKGYDIILNIGDQCSDINGGYSDKVFKLPNLMYSTYTAACA